MRLKSGFVLREICGEKVLSAEGKDVIDFSKLVRLNETSAYLWQALEGKDFDAQTMRDLLCEQYDVTPEQALKDSEALISQFVSIGLVEI
ncbi:MAG: PqqD family protein [Candidatus Cryptobacteroides sp.]